MTSVSIISLTNVDINEFLDFWTSLYRGPDEVYDKHIKFDEVLVRKDVRELMGWKSGKRHRDYAIRWADVAPLDLLNRQRTRFEMSDEEVRSRFKEVSDALKKRHVDESNTIIWPLFLCHVSAPHAIPIYDVNVWTAWLFIIDDLDLADLRHEPTKIKTYLKYRTWFLDTARTAGVGQRDLDRALMAFGQFLRSRVGRQCVSQLMKNDFEP